MNDLFDEVDDYDNRDLEMQNDLTNRSSCLKLNNNKNEYTKWVILLLIM